MRPALLTTFRCATVFTLLATFCAPPDVGASQEGDAANSTVPAVVFVPGVTGSRLEDPKTGEVLWGDASQLLSPKDRGYSTVLPLDDLGSGEANRFVPTNILSHMRLLTYTREVYRPLQRALLKAGHQLGELESPTAEKDLYYFTYDWRRENQRAVEELDQALTRIAKARDNPRVRLLCQSNAGRICRYVAKYGAADPAQLFETIEDPSAFAQLIPSPPTKWN